MARSSNWKESSSLTRSSGENDETSPKSPGIIPSFKHLEHISKVALILRFVTTTGAGGNHNNFNSRFRIMGKLIIRECGQWCICRLQLRRRGGNGWWYKSSRRQLIMIFFFKTPFSTCISFTWSQSLFLLLSAHCSKSSFFVQKLSIFWVKNSWKCWGFALFSCWQLWFPEKIAKFCHNWIVGPKFDFSNSVLCAFIFKIFKISFFKFRLRL